MADELRERARAYLNTTDEFHDERDYRICAGFAALMIEECAKIAEKSSIIYDVHFGCINKSREAIAKDIRSLTPLPTDGEDFGDVSEDQK